MRILLAAGGTAGHINPAIAVADCVKKKDKTAEILFAGTPNGMEARLVKQAGYRFVPIRVHGFQRSLTPKNVVRNLEAAYRLATSNFASSRILREFQPDVVIGTGGYVSGPLVRKAAQKGIYTAIHEQNAFPGVTNKMLAKKVDLVFLAVEEAKKHFPQTCKTIVVGNPVREKVLLKTREEARMELKMDDHFCILSFGGSLGAVKINEIAADMMAWHWKDGNINHIHACGRLGKKVFPGMLADRGIKPQENPRLDLREYIDNMGVCLAAADLVVCRAGALTLSELEATGKPSILVPSPNVAENHQYHNAMVLQQHGAAIVIEEKYYDREKLIEQLENLYQHPDVLRQYGKNASSLAILDTADRIYSEISAHFS